MYPEYTGTIEAEILKETPSSDPAQVLERSKLEMARRSQMDLLNPLGIDNTFVMVVRGEDARKYKVSTLSEAAQVTPGWKLGVGYEFEERMDGMPALNTYHLPMASAPRSMDLGLLYKAMELGQVTMIAANATDGPLAAHDWSILADDKKAFGSYQACILVRHEIENRGAAAEAGAGGAVRKIQQRDHAQAGRGSRRETSPDRSRGVGLPHASRAQIAYALCQYRG